MRHSAQEIQYLTTSTRLEKLKGKGGLQVSFEIYSISLPRTSYSSLVHGLYAYCMDLKPNPGSQQQITVLPKIYFYGRLGHCVCIIWLSCNSQQHLHWKERQVMQDFLLFSLCHGMKLHVSQVSIKLEPICPLPSEWETKFLFLARAIRFQLWMNSSSCTSQGQCAIFIRFTSLLHKVAIN